MSAGPTTKPRPGTSRPDDEPPRDERSAAPRGSSGRALVLVGAVLAVAVMLAVPVRSYLAQRSDLERERADNEAAQARVDALAAQKLRWEDPRYVAAQARLRLNMVKPGESGLIVLDHDVQQQQQGRQEPVVTTWYDKVWQATSSVAGPDQVADPDGDDAG